MFWRAGVVRRLDEAFQRPSHSNREARWTERCTLDPAKDIRRLKQCVSSDYVGDIRPLFLHRIDLEDSRVGMVSMTLVMCKGPLSFAN